MSQDEEKKPTIELEPAKRLWWCRLNLHRWSRWYLRESKTSQLKSYQYRGCLNCKLTQRRWIWPEASHVEIHGTDRFYDSVDRFFDSKEK